MATMIEPKVIEAAAISDRGQVRELNEDSVLLEDPASPAARARGILCVVADGMGGHSAGEVASRIAVHTVRSRYYENSNPHIAQALQEAIEAANAEVWQESQHHAGRAGMGCTLTAGVLHEGTLVVGHVGDSRAYLVREDSIVQITDDHSWVAQQVMAGNLTEEQAERHPNKNVILRAIGEKPLVQVDIYQEKLKAGDVLVLCTDGLTGMVTDEEIGIRAADMRPRKAAEALVKLANGRGAPDNLTVAVLRTGGSSPTVAGVPRQWMPFAAAVAALLVVGSSLFGLTRLAGSGDVAIIPTAPAGAPSPAVAATPILAAPPQSPTPRPTVATAWVSETTGANLRRKADSQSGSLGSLAYRHVVNIMGSETEGEEAEPGKGKKWYEVEARLAGEPARGYVYGPYLSREQPPTLMPVPPTATPTANRAPARTAASTTPPKPAATQAPSMPPGPP